MCFVWIWEQTAIISLYNSDWLVFITETECVYCAVRSTFYVLPPQCIYVFCADLRTNSDYLPIHNWLVGIGNGEALCSLWGRIRNLYIVYRCTNPDTQFTVDSPSHIRSSPFAVSLHTLQSPICTSSSFSPIPSWSVPCSFSSPLFTFASYLNSFQE